MNLQDYEDDISIYNYTVDMNMHFIPDIKYNEIRLSEPTQLDFLNF